MSQQRATDLTCNETLPLDEEPRLSGQQPTVRRFQVASTPSQGPFRVNYPPGQAPPQQKTYTASQIARPVASRSYTVANPAPPRNVIGGSTGIHNISSTSNTSTPIHRGFVAPNNVTRVIRPAPQQSDHDHGPVTFTTHATHQVPIVRHPLDNRFDIHGTRHSHTPQPVHQANLPSPFVNSLRLTQAPPAPPAGSKTAQGLLNVVQSMNRHSTSPSLGQFNQSIFGAQHFSQTNYGTGASTSRIVGASPIIPHPRFSAQNNGSGNKVVHSTPGVVRFQTTTPAAPMSHIQTPAIHRVQTTTPHIIHGNSGSQFVHPAAGLMGIAQTTVNTPSPRPSILRKPSTPGSAAKRKLGFGTELPGTSAGTISGASASPSMSSVRSIIQNTNDATNSVAKALGSVAAPVTNGTEGESPRKRPRKQQFDSSQHEPMMMAVGMEAIKTPIWELPRDHPMAQEYFRNMQMIPPEKKKRGRPRADATRSNATADQFMVQTGVRRVFVPMDQLPNQAISHIAQQQNQMLNPGMSNPAAAAIAAALEAVGLQNTFNTQASTSRTVVGNTLHNLNPNQTVKEALSQMAADKAKVDLERKTAEQAEAKARADAIARAHSAAQIEQVRAAVTASHATKGAPAKGRPTAEKKKAAAAAAAAAAANDPKVTTSKKESREVATKRAPAKKKTAPKKGAAKAKKPVEKEVKDEVEEEVKGKLKSPKKKKIIKKKKVVKGAAVKKVVAKKAPPKEMTIAEQENNALCYLTTLMRGNLRQKALLTKSETVTKMGLLKRYFPNKYRQVDEPVPSIRTNRPKLFFERYNSRWNHFNKIENLEKAYDDKKTARKIQKLNDNIRNRLRKQCKITAKNAVKQLEPKLLHFCKLNRLRAPELKSRKRFVKILTKVYMDRIEAFVKENYPHIRRKNEKQKEAEAEAAEKKQEEKEKQTDFAMKCIRLLKKRVRTGKVEKKFIGEGESRTLVQTFSKSMGRCRYEFTASETRKKNPKSKKVVKTKKALKVADKQDKKKLRERLAKLRAKASAKVKPAETAASNVEVKKEKDEQGIEANSSQSSVAALLTRPSKKAKNGTSTKLGNAASLPVAKPSNTSAMNSLVSALNAARFPSSSPAPGPSTFAPAGPSTASDLPGPSTSKTLSSASDDFCPKVLVSIAKASSKKPIHRRIIKVASEDEVVARLLADARCRSLSPAVKYVVATPEELKKDAEDKKRRLRKVDDNTRKSVLSKLQETADNGTLIGLQDSLKETAERESTSTTAEVKPEVKDEPPSDEPEVKQILKPTQPVTKPVASNEKPVKETLIKANKSILIPAASQPAPVPAIAKVPTAASGSVPKPKPAHKWKDIRPQEVAQPVVKNIRESVKESISKYNSTLAKASATSEKKNSTESVAVPTLPKKAKTALQPWQILRSKKILKEMGMWRSKKVADKKDASPAKLSKPKKARAMRRLSLRTMTAKRLAMNYLRELRKEKLQVSALPKKTEKQKLVRKKKKERHNNKVTKFFAFLEKSRILRVASKKKKSRKLKRMTPLQKKKFAAALHKAKQTGKAPLKVKKALKRKLKTVVAANKTVPGTAATKTLKKNVKERKKDSVPKKDKMKKIKKAKATGKQKVSKAVVKKNKKKSRALKKARYPLTRADRCAIEEVVDSLASAVSFELDKDQKERDAFENRSALRNLKGCPIMSNGMSELNRVLRAQKARQRMENYSLRQVFPASPPRSVHRPEDFDFRSNNVSIPTDYEKSKDWWAAVTGSKKVRSRNCKTRAEKRHEKMIRLLKKLKAEMKQNAKKPTEKPAAEDGKDERIYIAPAETSEKKITFVAFQKLLRKMHPSRRVAILRKVKKRMFDVKRNLRLKQAEDKMERRKARRLKKKKEKKAKRKLKKLKKIKKAKKKAEKLAAAEATKSDAAVKKEKESAEAGSSQQLACEEGLSVPPVAMEVEVETTVDSPKKRQKGRATKSKKQSVKKTTSVVAPVVDYRQFLRPIDRELTFADIFAEADKEDEAEAPKFKALKLSAIKVAEKSSAKPMASKASKDEKKEKEGKASKKVGKKKSKKAAKKESNKKKVVKRIRLNPARRHLIRLYGRGSRLRVTKRYRRKIRKAKKAVKLAKEMTSKRNIERCAMLKESKKYKLALEKAKWLRNGRGSKEAKKFLLEEWKLKLKSMKKVRKLKKKRREAEKKLKEKRKAQQKAAAEQLVKKQGMKPSVAKRHVKRTIRLPYSHPTAQDIAVRRFRDYQDTLLEQLDTDRKVLLMFEQYLKTWDPASYNKLQKDIIRDYEPGDSPDTISRKKLARIRVTLLRPQIELPPPKRPPHIEACDVVIINPSKATMNSTITSSSPFWEAPTCSKNDNNRRILRNGHMTSDRPDDWKPLDMTPRIIYPDEMAQWCTEDQRDMVLGNLDEVYEKYLASLGPDAPIDVPDDDSADFEEKPVVQGVSRRTLIFKHKGNEEVTFLGEVTKPKLELVDETDSPMNDPKTKAHWSMNRELLATSYKDIYDTSCLMVQTMLHMKASLCPEEKPAEVAPPATPEPVVVVEKKKPAPAPRAKKQPKTGKKAQKQQKAAAQAKKDAKKEPAKPRATPKHPRAPRTPVITESTFERQIRRAIQESLKSMPSTSQG